jgi:D-3-phosphoglycerate dehydrogenase
LQRSTEESKVENIILIDVLPEYLSESLVSKGYHVIQAHKFSREKIHALASEKNCGFVIRSRFKMNADFLEPVVSSVKFIARFGAGMENIDVGYCSSKGVVCFHSPEGNRDAVADHAMGLLLSLSKRISKSFFEVRQGQWLREPNRGWELQDKTVGVIGFGNTGSMFAKRLIGFDCKVLAYDKYLPQGYASAFSHVKEVEMSEIFEHADVISLHLPLSEETNGLVSDKFMAKFQKPICLINTSRGAMVHTKSVCEWLDKGKLLGFGVDVLDAESLSFESVSFSGNIPLQKLLNSDKVVITPHIAGWSFESNLKMAKILVDKIAADFPLT